MALLGADTDETYLLGKIAAGDKLAFEALYRAYFPRLSRFIGRMARSPALIEEVVNDTMLVVWQKAASFDGSCKPSTWIFAIAYRKTLKGLKASDEPVESDAALYEDEDRKSTRLNSSHSAVSRMPSTKIGRASCRERV